MCGAFMKRVKHIPPLNMNSTVALFKTLGRPEQAADMTTSYVEQRGNERKLFDPRN